MEDFNYSNLRIKDLVLPDGTTPYVLFVHRSAPKGLPFRSLEEILRFLVVNAQVNISLEGRFHILKNETIIDNKR